MPDLYILPRFISFFRKELFFRIYDQDRPDRISLFLKHMHQPVKFMIRFIARNHNIYRFFHILPTFLFTVFLYR